jgi:CBS domain-containing protein
VPVEDEQGRLVGLISHRRLLHLISRGLREQNVTVREVMVANPITVSPTTPTLEAIRLMRDKHIGCLPIVESGQLVGIVTSYDFLEAAAHLFHERLGQATPGANDNKLARTA